MGKVTGEMVVPEAEAETASPSDPISGSSALVSVLRAPAVVENRSRPKARATTGFPSKRALNERSFLWEVFMLTVGLG
jgi:hypothetical protein